VFGGRAAVDAGTLVVMSRMLGGGRGGVISSEGCCR
jgi:hypothetical protein